MPIETSLIISEGFAPPCVSLKDESGGCNEDGEPKVVLFAKAPKPLPEVPLEPKADVWPNAGWLKAVGFRNDEDRSVCPKLDGWLVCPKVDGGDCPNTLDV